MYKFVDEKGNRVRPQFKGSMEADFEMVRRWNASVTPQDHVYHLGDVGSGKRILASIVPHLNGHKRLIMGNHDQEDVRFYREIGFQKILGSQYGFKGLILSHIPIHPGCLYNKLNVHGHIHERPAPGPQYRNVSVEWTNFTPVLLDEVIR